MMRPRIAAVMLLALTAVLPLRAQLVSGRFVTSAYTWEQYDTVGTSATYLRAFQTAQLSVAQGDLSFHTYLQGALNATNEFGDLGRIRVYNLYLKWSNIGKAVDLTAGPPGRLCRRRGRDHRRRSGPRQAPRQRASRSSGMRARRWSGGTIGSPRAGTRGSPSADRSPRPLLENTKMGVSYVNWREDRPAYTSFRARDTTFAPYALPIEVNDQAYQYIGGDVQYRFLSKVSPVRAVRLRHQF